MADDIKIIPTTAERTAEITVNYSNPGGTLALIGDPGAFTVTLQQPTVVTPETNNDAHWMDVVDDGVTQKLSATQTILPVPERGRYRLHKEESVGSSFGVMYY